MCAKGVGILVMKKRGWLWLAWVCWGGVALKRLSGGCEGDDVDGALLGRL